MPKHLQAYNFSWHCHQNVEIHSRWTFKCSHGVIYHLIYLLTFIPFKEDELCVLVRIKLLFTRPSKEISANNRHIRYSDTYPVYWGLSIARNACYITINYFKYLPSIICQTLTSLYTERHVQSFRFSITLNATATIGIMCTPPITGWKSFTLDTSEAFGVLMW